MSGFTAMAMGGLFGLTLTKPLDATNRAFVA
jgi:hypothetical protein